MAEAARARCELTVYISRILTVCEEDKDLNSEIFAEQSFHKKNVVTNLLFNLIEFV